MNIRPDEQPGFEPAPLSLVSCYMAHAELTSSHQERGSAMSLHNVKAHAIAARAEKDVAKKLDAIACALEELAKALGTPSSQLNGKSPEERRLFK